jgi:GTP-binding protein
MAVTRSTPGIPPRIAIAGRPNVGKSSLFNRLIRRREAIVHDAPGVTRDRLERVCELGGRGFLLWDTGGLLPRADETLTENVSRQARAAIEQAELILLVVDGREGVTPVDEQLAELLHGSGKPVVLVVNKIDLDMHEPLIADGWRLGLGEPFPVSAEHGRGVDRLVDEILERLPDAPPLVPGEEDARPDPEAELQIAIVGRPNVGKSSIVNRLAGEERITVSPEPGTTRDAVDVVMRRNGRGFRLVDTAGLRRRTRVARRDEAIGILLSRRRLERCHVAILVVDASMGVTSQDVSIAGEIADMGRPLVLALNKWDLVEQPEQAIRAITDTLSRRMGFVDYAPRITLSALSGRRAPKLLDACVEVARAASRRIKTADLNRFLGGTRDDLAAAGTGAPKSLYITQTGVLPPRFVVFARHRERATPAYRRFLENRLREAFELGPTPVVIDLRLDDGRRNS